MGVAITAFLMVALTAPAVAQTAHQGSTTQPPKPDPANYEEFKSPMVLETVFLPADRNLWRQEWFTGVEYQRLRRFRCDLVSIIGLEMGAKETPGDKMELGVKVTLHNPDHGHDKRVRLLFEVLDGETVVAQFSMPEAKVKEGAVVSKTLATSMSLAVLKVDPSPKMRITMTNWDY